MPKPYHSNADMSEKKMTPVEDSMNEKKLAKRVWYFVLLVTTVLLLLVACSGNYGKLLYSKEIGQNFRNFEMHSDYKYFFRGRAARPTVIVGINPEYEFSSEFWTAIEPEQFKTMVGRLTVNDYGIINGAYIISPDGHKVGVWYSWINLAAIKFEDEQITIKITDARAKRI